MTSYNKHQHTKTSQSTDSDLEALAAELLKQ